MRRFLFISFILGCFGLYMVFQFFRVASDKKLNVNTVDSIPSEYKALFAGADKKITFGESYILYNTNINPISKFMYDSKYWVVVLKLKTADHFDLAKTFHLNYGGSNLTLDRGYAGFDLGSYSFNILPDSDRVSSIYLNVNGKVLNGSTKNDTVLSYNFQFKSLSISYAGLKNHNLYFESSNYYATTAVVFLRRKTALYILLLSNNNPKRPIPDFDLKNIIDH